MAGGLGGLGGYINSPAGGNMLQALGMSLMSSPRNAPLQNFGQYFGMLGNQQMKQDALNQERADLVAGQDAMAQALVAAGVPEPEAKTLAINPAAAKIRLEQIETERQRAESDRFNSLLLGSGGGVDAGVSAGGGFGSPAPSDASADQSASAVNSGLPQGGMDTTDVTPAASGSSGNKTLDWLKQNDPEVAALADQGFSPADLYQIAQVRQQGGQPQSQQKQAGGGNAGASRQVAQSSQTSPLQSLMARRDQLYQLAITARTPENRRAAEIAIQNNEQKIAQEQEKFARNKTFNAIYSEDPELAQQVFDGLVPVNTAYKQLLENRKFRFEQEQADRTSQSKNYDLYSQDEIAAGRRPLGRLEYEQALRSAGATNVNVGAGEKAWDTESAKLFAKRYDDITSAAGNAQQMMGMYDLAEQALNSGVRTGLGADAELTLRQLGSAMGVDTDPQKLAGGELIRAVQNRMALTMRSPDGGMGMPGALSDRDIKFLKDSQVGLDRSPEGNRRMLDAFRAMERRKIELAQLADQYVQQNGRLDAGFNQAVREYANANPLFPEAPSSGGTARPTSEEDYNALPSGSLFVDPDDGKTYRKP